MSRRAGRREFLARGGRAVAGLAALRAARIEAAPEFDLVVRGGAVLDGTGGPAFAADLGIAGDTIAALGSIGPERGRRVIDARGLHVAPGFIDIHTHSDGGLLVYPTAESRVRQGVTTELGGNCGSSAAPLAGTAADERRRQWREEDELDADWPDLASYCARVEAAGVSVNQALLVGQGTLRSNAIGELDRPLAADEMKGLLRAVEEAMEQGAFGLSTGLEYTPGRFTPTAEIVELARVVARRGGLYASHVRNEEAMLLEAVDEAIEIGRRAGLRVQISHLKAAGRGNWPKQRAALDLIESAHRAGVEVLADAYPYTAYSTSLTILIPDWALDGGREAMLARLRDREQRARLRREVARRVLEEPGDFDRIVISSVPGEANQPVVGKDLVRIAAGWGVEPVDALLRLVEEERSVGFVGHAMSEQNVGLVLGHPLVMVGSDGRSMAPVKRAARTRPHPRSYGTFPRVLGLYCRERRLFDLPTAVRKMTSLPADQIGLRDRGRVARGMKADLVAFDPAAVRDVATFEDPHRYPEGLPHVIVNGVAVVESGRHTGARPGRMLRRG